MIYKLPVYRVQLVRERLLNTPFRAVRGPEDAVRIFRELHGDIDRECLVEVMLDAKRNVRGINTVSIGDLTSAIVHPREVFKPAILANAESFVLLHPHPSGDPTPSAEDMSISRRIKSVGEILGIELLDSIVTGDGDYRSLSESGYL